MYRMQLALAYVSPAVFSRQPVPLAVTLKPSSVEEQKDCAVGFRRAIVRIRKVVLR
jgi:hypothetical protein